ncbi:hypothetical protein TspCOW1_29750 [Thiohalobacter sp. COW1]|uniref:hypothetical protein n=1 Tax=Thiohalobacter sp. COW1 TaxID=2795687 RepID=UPI0019151911|nr:hypothetical protein [Thiohalobacter sp. COW1]BCO32872.1 hypothetical protein TspCOW1_29750 [Thiohalobacter sp. COW1]
MTPHDSHKLLQLADGIDSLGDDLTTVSTIGKMDHQQLLDMAANQPEKMERLFQRFRKIETTISTLQELLQSWQGQLALAQREATDPGRLDS